MTTSPLNNFLNRSEALARLHEHASYLARLQRKLETSLQPAMRKGVHVANLADGELTLHVDTPTLATRLKLSQKSLLADLQVAGEPVRTLRVKVRAQPYLGNDRYDVAEPRAIGEGGKEALGALQATLRPDDPLARALQRILSRSR